MSVNDDVEAPAEAASRNRTAQAAEQEVVEKEVVKEEQAVEEVDEEDDFGEDSMAIMVGYGVSDEISVWSSLTTPTVVPELHVSEEEHYKEETLPPMIAGCPGEPSMINAATKQKKSLVSQLRPPAGVLAPPGSRRNVGVGVGHGAGGGAASARRKRYQDTMAKLHENPNGMGHAGPSAAPITPPVITSSKPKTTGKSSVKIGGTAAAAAPKAPGVSFDDPKKSSGLGNDGGGSKPRKSKSKKSSGSGEREHSEQRKSTRSSTRSGSTKRASRRTSAA